MAKNAQRRARGGRTYYDGGGSNVAKAAAARASGGKICDMPSGKASGRIDKRARGGGVGCDKSPYSSAKIKG